MDFVLRSGDIDAAYMGMKRMQEGVAAHKYVQAKRKKEAVSSGFLYESEVTLKYSFEYKDFLYNLDGRADGILTTDTGVLIEEMKSTYRPLNEITEPSETHLAQVKCYAFMYLSLRGAPDGMGVKVTYIGCESMETAEFELYFNEADLREFFYDIAGRYYEYAEMDYNRVKARDVSADAMTFPFGGYRKNQREYMAAAYTAIVKGKKLFAQAPTGTGKTISVLFPAIKALSKSECEKIFYLTAKTVTRQAAEETLSILKGRGLVMRSVTITAREKICLNDVYTCNPDRCPYAKGHFDRVNLAVKDIVLNETAMTRETVLAYAAKHGVCPFEFELDITVFCDVVVCDYNYAYNPKTQFKNFFDGPGKRDFVVLTDEAHNLVDRAREMFSACLRLEAFVLVRRALKADGEGGAAVLAAIKGVTALMKDVIKNVLGEERFVVGEEAPAELCGALTEFVAEADDWLTNNKTHAAVDDMTDTFFSALDFLRVSELFDDRYRLYYEGAKNRLTVKYFCMDPSFLLSRTLNKVKSAVFFSATLTPLKYFKDLLGGAEDDYALRIPSPFEPDKLCVLVENRISTKYRDRQRSCGKVSDAVYDFVTAKTGNYFVFFSSYEYMALVYADFTERYADIGTVVQAQEMPEEEREAFLKRFGPSPDKTLVGFLVLGGVFSEGIDLKADRLIGAAIVGVGLPLISREREMISEYYQNLNGQGFDYAYAYPGMNKVMQAAGRVIRQESDVGAVLLIDSRFLSEPYVGLFPAEWKNFQKCGPSGNIYKIMEDFWIDFKE